MQPDTRPAAADRPVPDPAHTARHCAEATGSGGTEYAEFRRPAHRPGIELYRADLAHVAFAPHAHDAYGIGAIAGGVERLRYRGSEHLAPAGSLILMHPGEMHTGAPASPERWRYAMLYLDREVLPELLGRPLPAGSHLDFAAVFPHDPARAARLVAGLDTLWTAHEPLAFDSLLASLAESCLLPHLRGARPTPRPADPRLARVADYVDAHLGESLTVDALARQAGLSPYHFLRAFRASTGSTPHEYVMARRVAAAKRALAAGMAPAHAAALHGFADQSHLNRWLYRTHGTTPGRYRRQVAGTSPR